MNLTVQVSFPVKTDKVWNSANTQMNTRRQWSFKSHFQQQCWQMDFYAKKIWGKLVELMLYFIIIMNLLQEHLHFWSKHFRCLVLITQNHHDSVVLLSLTLPGTNPRLAHTSLERKKRSACWLKMAQTKTVLPFGKGLPFMKSLTVPQTTWLNLVLLNWMI